MGGGFSFPPAAMERAGSYTAQYTLRPASPDGAFLAATAALTVVPGPPVRLCVEVMRGPHPVPFA